MMIAAPTPRPGQIAPNSWTESWRLSRTIGGRDPIGAQTYSSDPFCPTLASSWNHTSMSFSIADGGKTSRLRLRNFFICLLGCGVFLRMERPWLQPCELQFAQPLRHRPRVDRDREAFRDLLPP